MGTVFEPLESSSGGLPQPQRSPACHLLQEWDDVPLARACDTYREASQDSSAALENDRIRMLGRQELRMEIEIRPRHKQGRGYFEARPIVVVAPRRVWKSLEID